MTTCARGGGTRCHGRPSVCNMLIPPNSPMSDPPPIINHRIGLTGFPDATARTKNKTRSKPPHPHSTSSQTHLFKKRTNFMSVTNSEHQRLKTRKHKVYERAHSNASSHVWYMCEPCQDQCLENYMGVATLHLFTNPTAQKTNRHHECHKLGTSTSLDSET